MNSTLNTIQTLSKIGRVFSKIIYICCIVGTVSCIIGMASLAAGLDGALKWHGVTIHGIIESSADMSVGNLYAAMATGLIFCIAEGIIAKFAEVYFKHELSDGTPFTLAGSKELLRLGILTIALPLGGTVLAAIIHGVMEHAMAGVTDVTRGDLSSVSLGVMFLVLSVVLRYGAELGASSAEEARNE